MRVKRILLDLFVVFPVSAVVLAGIFPIGMLILSEIIFNIRENIVDLKIRWGIHECSGQTYRKTDHEWSSGTVIQSDVPRHRRIVDDGLRYQVIDIVKKECRHCHATKKERIHKRDRVIPSENLEDTQFL